MNDVDAFLAHHGIKGQKWGIRHEPKSSNGRVGMTDTEANAQFIGIGAILAVYGAVAIAQFKDAGRFHSIAEKGRRAFTSRNDWNKKPGLSKPMSSDAIMSNVVKQINPGYGGRGTKMNCRRCTFAYEMRRRGYDVKATKSLHATGQHIKGVAKAISVKPRDFHPDTLFGKHLIYTGHNVNHGAEVFKKLSKEPNGARGELGVQFMFGGGHSMAWENVKNKPVIFDTQNGKHFSNSKDLGNYLNNMHVSQSSYTRLDNTKLNQDFLTRWLANAS